MTDTATTSTAQAQPPPKALEEMQPLWARLQSQFWGPYMMVHEDLIITTSFPDGSPQSEKVARLVMITHVGEGYRHVGVAVPRLGTEWKLIANELRRWIGKIERDIKIEWGHQGLGVEDRLEDAPFTKNVFFFTDCLEVPKGEIVAGLKLRGFRTKFIDDLSWKTMWSSRSPDAFLCHDARDQDPFVQSLFHELTRRMLKVWYSESALRVGDNLVAKIDQGLTSCRHAILVVSKNLLENTGWASSEMSALLNRQSGDETKNVILPVWLAVERKDVAARSTLLANRVALKSSEGIATIADKLAQVIRESAKPTPAS